MTKFVFIKRKENDFAETDYLDGHIDEDLPRVKCFINVKLLQFFFFFLL